MNRTVVRSIYPAQTFCLVVHVGVYGCTNVIAVLREAGGVDVSAALSRSLPQSGVYHVYPVVLGIFGDG